MMSWKGSKCIWGLTGSLNILYIMMSWKGSKCIWGLTGSLNYFIYDVLEGK